MQKNLCLSCAMDLAKRADIRSFGRPTHLGMCAACGDAIMAALFAADADMWKREAILNIRDYFGSELPEEILGDVIILA